MGSFAAGWVAGDVVDAADLNTIAGAWDAFTPTLTNITLGDGTATGYKKKIGRAMFIWVKITLGSTSSVSGSIRIDLPETAVATQSGSFQGEFYDDSAGAFYPAHVIHNGTTFVTLRAVNTASTYASGTATTSTIPFTWATSDWVLLNGFYEAAS